MTDAVPHKPVMLGEVIDLLAPKDDACYVDGEKVVAQQGDCASLLDFVYKVNMTELLLTVKHLKIDKTVQFHFQVLASIPSLAIRPQQHKNKKLGKAWKRGYMHLYVTYTHKYVGSG